MKYICALVTVSDMKRARAFYEEVLGQKIKYDFGENVSYEGDFSLHLRSHYQGLIGDHPISSGGNNFELYFEYDDVDALVEKLDAAGVRYVHELREQPWRQKVVRFFDPDDTIIEVGESMEFLCYRLSGEGLSVEEIVKMTTMPEAFVTNSISQFSS